MAERQTIVFVGGGLANGLAALRLVQARPDAEVLVLEADDRAGGYHTWCFHGEDLDPADRPWVLPLASRSWPAYDVRFPGYGRTLGAGYHAVRSPDFHRQVAEALGGRLRLRTPVRAVAPSHVTLAGGGRIEADLVVDGRGFADDAPPLGGYQKFYGLFVRTAAPHGFTRPLLMDATVEQLDGYRFVYVLPWSETELLVEDTRYSADPGLRVPELRLGIEAYLRRAGLAPFIVTADEKGVLPLPFHGAPAPAAVPGVVLSGVRAGLFHPTTGYSLPDAVRFASWLARQPRLASADLAAAAARRAQGVWRRGAFCRRLNNMLFFAATPSERRRVLAQFYRRDPALIGRFYAGRLSVADRLRLLSGRPPVPLAAGLRAFFARAAFG